MRLWSGIFIVIVSTILGGLLLGPIQNLLNARRHRSSRRSLQVGSLVVDDLTLQSEGKKHLTPIINLTQQAIPFGPRNKFVVLMIGIICIPTLSSAQNVNYELCYRPPLFPARFCGDQSLSVSVQSTKEWVTPIGVFSIGTKYSSQENTYSLRINYRDSSYIYEIDSDHRVEVYIKGESKGVYENQEALIEVEDSSEVMVVFLPIETVDTDLPTKQEWNYFLRPRFGLASNTTGAQLINELGNPTEVLNDDDDWKTYTYLNQHGQRIVAAYIDKSTDKLEVLAIYSVDGTTGFFQSRYLPLTPIRYFGLSVDETMDILDLLGFSGQWEVAYNAIYHNPNPCNQDDCSMAWIAFYRPFGALRNSEVVKFELYFNGFEPDVMNSRASNR